MPPIFDFINDDPKFWGTLLLAIVFAIYGLVAFLITRWIDGKKKEPSRMD